MARTFDPLKAQEALQSAADGKGEVLAADLLGPVKKAVRKRRKAPEGLSLPKEMPEELKSAVRLSRAIDPQAVPPPSERKTHPAPHKAKMVEKKESRGQRLTLRERIVKDFRVLLTLIWRELLGVDPSPIQLDMAYWLQHGPDRSIIMAFRGFSKSWITGAYALWRLYCDPNEKILVVSGSLARAVATTNWCLELIMRMDVFEEMRPQPNGRSSSKMFDVGNCVPAQSASFMAMGIGGQLVGFRGTCIIPDDVETQQNSLTVLMRDKNKEAVKEFESVLTPNGVIKYLGTPHDLDSLYLDLQKKGYTARIWPAKFPRPEEQGVYGSALAPYVLRYIEKHGPECYGKPTMPNRFPSEELDRRELAMGRSEFALQFMINLAAGMENTYPLKVRDISVMDLDDLKGPDSVSWGTSRIDNDLQPMGFDGDFYYYPASVSTTYSPFTAVKGHVDPSGKGKDETALSIVGYLNGRLYWLTMVASKDGFEPHVLKAIAQACVRFRCRYLSVEDNFGGGMFSTLLRPVLQQEWDLHNKRVRAEDHGSTTVEDLNSGKQGKEKRMVGILEPILQSHRLVANRSVFQGDFQSIMSMDGEDGRRDYSVAYQLTHLTQERDCLRRNDRIESLAGACSLFQDVMGVDPEMALQRLQADREEERMAKLLGWDDDLLGHPHRPEDSRMRSARPTSR